MSDPMLAVAWGEALGVEMLRVADSAGDQPKATFPGGHGRAGRGDWLTCLSIWALEEDEGEQH